MLFGDNDKNNTKKNKSNNKSNGKSNSKSQYTDNTNNSQTFEDVLNNLQTTQSDVYPRSSQLEALGNIVLMKCFKLKPITFKFKNHEPIKWSYLKEDQLLKYSVRNNVEYIDGAFINPLNGQMILCQAKYFEKPKSYSSYNVDMIKQAFQKYQPFKICYFVKETTKRLNNSVDIVFTFDELLHLYTIYRMNEGKWFNTLIYKLQTQLSNVKNQKSDKTQKSDKSNKSDKGYKFVISQTQVKSLINDKRINERYTIQQIYDLIYDYFFFTIHHQKSMKCKLVVPKLNILQKKESYIEFIVSK